MINKNRTLLSIEPYKLKGKEFDELRRKYNNRDYFYEKFLPKYCIDEKNNIIKRSEEFLYYITSQDENEYYLFDIATPDKLLNEEISNDDFDGLLRQENTENEKILCDIIKNKLVLYNYKDFNKSLPVSQYIVIDLIYSGGTFYEPYDIELYVNLIGYMDKDLKLIEIENIETINK